MGLFQRAASSDAADHATSDSVGRDDAETKAGVPPVSVKPAPQLLVFPCDEQTIRKRQEEWAEYLSEPVEKEILLSKNVRLTMVLIPPGTFDIGTKSEAWEKLRTDPVALNELGTVGLIDLTWGENPEKRVTIDKPFYLGHYEVTQLQWQAVMENNPSFFKGKPSNPVETVSKNDRSVFLETLNNRVKLDGWRFELPSEEQWEYACRAGSEALYYFGDSAADLHQYEWFRDNSLDTTHPVGMFKPNGFGLYDMLGNVSEYVNGTWGSYGNPSSDPVRSLYLLSRGGSFASLPVACRSAIRNHFSYSEDRVSRHIGIRVALLPKQ